MQLATAGIWLDSTPQSSWSVLAVGNGPHGASARVQRANAHGTSMGDDSQDAGANPARWIAAIAASQDRAAFAALFGFYAPRIKTMLMRMGANAEAAEDIAQEALVTVWRKAAQYDPSRAGASAWIYTIARNLRIDRLRRDQRAKLFALYETVELEEPQRPDGPMDIAQREACVRAALLQLPEEQVRVIQLSFFEGRAHGDIARLLELPLGTVKSRLRLAMSRLRHLIGDAL
jgi:RNA polymerase sigma-70 factor (ECF subfamily)